MASLSFQGSHLLLQPSSHCHAVIPELPPILPYPNILRSIDPGPKRSWNGVRLSIGPQCRLKWASYDGLMIKKLSLIRARLNKLEARLSWFGLADYLLTHVVIRSHPTIGLHVTIIRYVVSNFRKRYKMTCYPDRIE